MYGRLQEADPLIAELCNDKDAILRRSGMYTIAMAYCGTGRNCLKRVPTTEVVGITEAEITFDI